MEVILSRAYAEKLYGNANVVGNPLLLDDRIFTIVAVLDFWEMVPKLYDIRNGVYLEPVEDIYLPLETAYDLNYRQNTSNTFEPVNQKKLATEGREKAFHRLQFWVELGSTEKVQAYKEFMASVVAEEKRVGRHPSPEANRLDPMSHILEAFRVDNKEIKAYALVTLLFLGVCLFNASHLSLNRYLANQYEFSLRRALGASAAQLQLQIAADVLISSALSMVFASFIAWLGIALINHFLPGNQLLARWNGTLVISGCTLSIATHNVW
jgi:putative ABC transport system permease protein